MLVDMWEEVLSSMEGGATAAVVLGVDYEKAFNEWSMRFACENWRSWGPLRAAYH